MPIISYPLARYAPATSLLPWGSGICPGPVHCRVSSRFCCRKLSPARDTRIRLQPLLSLEDASARGEFISRTRICPIWPHCYLKLYFQLVTRAECPSRGVLIPTPWCPMRSPRPLIQCVGALSSPTTYASPAPGTQVALWCACAANACTYRKGSALHDRSSTSSSDLWHSKEARAGDSDRLPGMQRWLRYYCLCGR